MPTTRTFRIVSPSPQVLLIQVKATDKTDQSIVNNFKLNFTNAPPKIVTAMPDIVINTQESFEYKIPSTAYIDPANQNISLTHNILALPNLAGWLRFNPITWTFYGVPPASSAGTYTIQLQANDPFTGFVKDPFDLKINSRPIIHSVNGMLPSI
jgi:hypothetical protein